MSTIIHAKVGSQEGTAILWYKNGDHPDDGPANQEGKVIRYFRHPEIDSESICEHCGHKMHDHGFVEKGNHINVPSAGLDLSCSVCPGDWVMQLVGSSEFIVCNQDNFVNTFYHVESMKNKAYAANFKMCETVKEVFAYRLNDPTINEILKRLLVNPSVRHELNICINDEVESVYFSTKHENFNDPAKECMSVVFSK